MKRMVALLCAAGLAGCTVGPDYVRPTLEVPASFKEADTATGLPLERLRQGAWWEVFGDPVLNHLQTQLTDANPQLQIAAAQHRAALAVARGTRAGWLPSLGGQLASSRSQTSGETAKGGGRTLQNDHLIGFAAFWEADLWGRIGREVEAGEAGARASAADLDGVRLFLQAELARQYFLLRISDAQRRLLEDSVAAYGKSLELTRNRRAAGVATELDVAQADTQWKTARAQLVDLGIERGQLEHGIAVLLGRPPADFSLPPAETGAALPARLPTIPADLPASLLERRPDVAAAERRAAAAHARIGAARAAFFPSLTLAASAGSESQTLGHWLTGPSAVWALGSSVVASLFDGGARRSRVDQAEAASQASIATYRQVVLQAFQEVEDGLSRLRLLTQEAVLQDEALAAARRTETLTANLYRLGTVSYLNVVTAQAAALNNERTALDLLARRLTASVALIKALGGGWTASGAGELAARDR